VGFHGLFGTVSIIAVAMGPHLCAQTTLLHSDNSDWWSTYRSLGPRELTAKAQNREPDTSLFQILGVNLGDDDFEHLEAKLGKVARIGRGDASTGREQICYVSAERQPVHLIFEKGELDESYYLFTGGKAWKGIDLCGKSNLVSVGLTAGNGLRLQQTRPQVEAILGKPVVSRPDRIYYTFRVRKKRPDSKLKKLRDENPKSSDKEFHETFDFYSLWVYVEARFERSKLNYLAVSKSETD